MRKKLLCIGLLTLIMGTGTAYAYTSDGLIPAQETVCDDAGLTGALWGLCNAYCQAMDCDSASPKASLEACRKTAQKYAEKSGGGILPCEGVVSNDQDGDGIPDDSDNCPMLSNVKQTDRDEDGVGDVCDNCAELANPGQEDNDGNNIGDVCECGACTDDNDQDGIVDMDDNCPAVPNAGQENSDFDSYGDACDNCPYVANNQDDTNGNGIGNACEADNDLDDDGVFDSVDNCPNIANGDQSDVDGDTLGDVCDNCPYSDNEDQADTDEDTVGDACDNCPQTANHEQYNFDEDGYGDACDNCVEYANNDQADDDSDGVGDACEVPDNQLDTDGDGFVDIYDNCPYVTNNDQVDNNYNNIGDSCECPCFDFNYLKISKEALENEFERVSVSKVDKDDGLTIEIIGVTPKNDPTHTKESFTFDITMPGYNNNYYKCTAISNRTTKLQGERAVGTGLAHPERIISDSQYDACKEVMMKVEQNLN